jgi:hypothetical protein
MNYGADYRFGSGMSSTSVHKILICQLVVDFRVVNDKKLIGRGTASDTVSGEDKPEKSEKTRD